MPLLSQGDIRPYLSEPDLLGLGEPDLSYEALEPDAGYQTLPSKGKLPAPPGKSTPIQTQTSEYDTSYSSPGL